MRNAFPELALYCVAVKATGGDDSDDETHSRESVREKQDTMSATISGLSLEAEYRRTIGALFRCRSSLLVGSVTSQT